MNNKIDNNSNDDNIQTDNGQAASSSELQDRRAEIDQKAADMPTELGGRAKDKGLEPTRYGDWELKGRCIDF